MKTSSRTSGGRRAFKRLLSIVRACHISSALSCTREYMLADLLANSHCRSGPLISSDLCEDDRKEGVAGDEKKGSDANRCCTL